MNESREQWDDMVVVGRIARAHGNRGQVIVNVETDFPARRFQPDRVVYLNADGGPQPCRIAASRFHAGRPVLTLEGVETMSQAEALSGYELRVPEATLPPLPVGTFYQHDLVGCEVTTTTGAVVGTVVAVRGSAGANRLIVRPAGRDGTDGGPGGGGDEIEMPLAEPICVRIEPRRKMVIVDPPDGLLELNRRS